MVAAKRNRHKVVPLRLRTAASVENNNILLITCDKP
ncbi:Uncharacterised protein [Pseudomonas putida]|jgi:hypothetical protein|nr:Uncharacterised protein [Pseudomonas putida]